jgi:hypothetical protein
LYSLPTPEDATLEMFHLLQELERNSNEIRKDIWCDNSDHDFDGVLQCLSQLHAQLEVQKALQRTAKLLRQHVNDKSLPNQQANRLKHFIKFVFEKANRGHKQQIHFQKLECNALKFCGLSYTVREILELPTAQFDFLIENIADFIHRQKLIH